MNQLYEIVWTYRGSEYVLARHKRAARALADFERGRCRCHALVHGGSLRVDEVTHEGAPTERTPTGVKAARR